jgi:DNA (cytosine-5)-methyltransferase 1
MITFGSLFAGIGGFDLGFERAGMRAIWNVEREATCRALLSVKFPNATQHCDVRTVGALNLPSVDVLCGGFPCQDLSVAGKRAGLRGARSGLFYEFTRIAYELRPRFVVWENVPGLLSSDQGRDFARVLHELGRIGYHGAWRVLDAQHFGVAQRRRRVFGVFARGDLGAGPCAEILSLAEGLRGHPSPSGKTRKNATGTLSARTGGGGGLGTDFECSGGLQVSSSLTSKWAKGTGGPSGDECQNLTLAFSSKDHGADAGELAPTLRAMGHRESHMNGGGQIAVAQTLTAEMYRSGGATAGKNQGVRNVILPGVRRLTPRECERLQGFPDDWTAGFSDSVRYRMLGNAVAVPCAEWIGRRLLAHTQS